MSLSSLGDQFPGRYWPSPSGFERLWTEGIVVLDASVLLSFHRYSLDTRSALFNVLARFEGRIFVPHQAALEYQRNRISVIFQQVAAYRELEQELTKSLETLRSRANQLRRHPVLEADEVLKRLETFKSDLTSYIDGRKAAHPNLDLTPERLMNDPVRDAIAAAVGESVGLPYDADAHKDAEAEAGRRLDADEPPGYMDKAKPGPERYGDGIFWLQALDYAKKVRRPIIVVTDDEKEDWWWIDKGGRTLGPRPELVEEMTSASEHPMFMYTSRRLLEAARQYLKEAVSDAAIDEVERVASALRLETSVVMVECPHCGWGPTEVKVGTATGSSAIVRCENCEHRFHAHRMSSGEVRASRGSLGRRLALECPECSNRIQVDFSDGDTKSKTRVCMSCLSLVEVDPSGSTSAVGRATVVDAERLDPRHILCPRCEVPHFVFREQGGDAFANCFTGEPQLLLRSTA